MSTLRLSAYPAPAGLSLLAGVPAQAFELIIGCDPITLDDVTPFHPPPFEQYPVNRMRGTPAKADITSRPWPRRFRTMLRLQAPTGPNFAGHYTIAGWGCGSSCLQFAVIDAITGKVYVPRTLIP